MSRRMGAFARLANWSLLALPISVLTMAACQKAPGLHSASLNSGIVNGTDADGTEPFTGSVIGLGTKEGNGFAIFCSGTLINQNTIVTAAHCVDALDADTYIVFGLQEKAKNVQGRKIVRSATHDNWNPSFTDDQKDVFDIGLAQFDGGIPDGFKPMDILPNDSELQNGTEIILAGYGVTSGTQQMGNGILRYTKVKIADSKYGNTEVMTDESKSGSCNGDSGGPGMILSQDGHYYVWGTTSRGDTACVQNGIYTKVTSYHDWITKRLATWSQPAQPQPQPQPSPAPVAAGF